VEKVERRGNKEMRRCERWWWSKGFLKGERGE